MSGVDALVARGIADPDKLAHIGWSYGGYMTAWVITQTTRFKAAMVGAGLTNMWSMYGTNDIPSVLIAYFGGIPEREDAAALPGAVGDDAHRQGDDADADPARRQRRARAGRAGPGAVPRP